jgi:hypothetical protein
MAAELAGITVDAVREQLLQLGHSDVSDDLIADFLRQLSVETMEGSVAAAGETQDATVDAAGEGELEYERDAPRATYAPATPRATLRALEGNEYGGAGRDGSGEAVQQLAGAAGVRPRTARSPPQALAPPLKSPATFESPAHKRAAHATPGGTHTARGGDASGRAAHLNK